MKLGASKEIVVDATAEEGKRPPARLLHWLLLVLLSLKSKFIHTPLGLRRWRGILSRFAVRFDTTRSPRGNFPEEGERARAFKSEEKGTQRSKRQGEPRSEARSDLW